MRKNTLLIMPAHNEDMNIGKVIVALKDAGIFEKMDLLVINDGSTDSTAEVVRQYREVRLINQIYNMGYGAALQPVISTQWNMTTIMCYRWIQTASTMSATWRSF